ncbi:hypothetical protein [Bacteroides sp. 51]|uniref:hypothetical protein n=1 Tax=Bacteroides sp. 51 TaxID=2302938 RepID=UPI0013D4C20A|nr:hypothetical protein [Bacteroides sp. 51]NDV80452.1 hypothetical protein [Bacteroides sp. 51]
MKLNLFLSIIAVVVSGLVFYGLYEVNNEKLIYPITATVVNVALLVFTMGVSFEGYPRSTTMAKTSTGIFWFIALVMNVLFVVFEAPNVVLIITNVLLLSICAAVVYGILKSKQ